jgi:rhamnose utilization protein RhaD (predicted bifunctional aldolase and dehydrogenase)
MLDELAEVSALFGSDLNLVQGLGGNTSFKNENTLWIKASGLPLKEAAKRDIFLPLSRQCIQRAIALDTEAAINDCVINKSSGQALRPSIETALHEILPHKVVFHGHPVETLSHIVSFPDLIELERLLNGLSWALIPYAKPGFSLMKSISRYPNKDIYLLQNHGLLVGAETPAQAYNLFTEVERRLARSVQIPSSIYCPFFSNKEYEVIYSPWIQAFVENVELIKKVSNVSLYPDHVVILGIGVPILQSLTQLNETSSEWFIIPGFAAIGRRNRHSAVDDMIEALARISLRLKEEVQLLSLSKTDCADLLNWDSEKYRRLLQLRPVK